MVRSHANSVCPVTSQAYRVSRKVITNVLIGRRGEGGIGVLQLLNLVYMEVNVAIQVKRAMIDKEKYKWVAGEGDSKTSVAHDRIMFNRRQGYEVMPMIQKVVNHFGYETEEDVKRVEMAIRTALPGNVRSRKNVFNWLVEHLSS